MRDSEVAVATAARSSSSRHAIDGGGGGGASSKTLSTVAVDFIYCIFVCAVSVCQSDAIFFFSSFAFVCPSTVCLRRISTTLHVAILHFTAGQMCPRW